MKQNERDKFTARLFKNRQKKQLKILTTISLEQK